MSNGGAAQCNLDTECHLMRPVLFRLTGRILDSVHLQAVKDAVKLRQQMMPQVMEAMRNSAKTGAPALRPLSYNYLDKGYENIKEEFMIGDQILVAPVVTENDERMIVLPPGDWYYQNKKWKGGKAYEIKVALNELLVFMKKAKQ